MRTITKLGLPVVAATLAAWPVASMAQPYPGLYIGGGAGGNIMGDQTLKSVTVPEALAPGLGGVIPLNGRLTNGTISMRSGLAGEASVGWGFGELTPFGGPRVEIEGNYSQNQFQSVSVAPGIFVPAGNRFSAGGREQKYGAFANLIWDFDIGVPWVYPYIGGGAGYQWSLWNARFNNVLGAGAGTPSVTQFSSNNTQGSFAYQGIIGVSFPILPVPGLSISTDFRYIGLSGNRNYKANISGVNSAGAFFSDPAGISTSGNHNYTFLLGVRYAFNVAPPPPPPAPIVAPAPAPARSYLVFFDWDKATLTDRARQIIREAAENSTRVQYTRIEVNGYTDTSGSAAYNQRLSVRRAEAVAAELVKNGVPRNAITVQGFGETHLLVPTGPNVREPQNRRVEIIIR
jgi:OOP family OmpA-OmpF porin